MFIYMTNNMSDYKVYAQHNVAIITGRVAAAKVCTKNNSEFLAVTLIHNSEDGDKGTEFTFTTNAGLLSFVKKGYDLVGRMLTVTGHMARPEGHYVNANGEAVLLQRPRVKLIGASVMPGGLGPAKKDDKVQGAPKGTILKPAQAKQELDRREAAPVDEIDLVAGSAFGA